MLAKIGGRVARVDGQKSLELWMHGHDREVAVALSARAALRVLPLISENWRGLEPTKKRHSIVLPTFRATLCALVAAVQPIPRSIQVDLVATASAARIARRASSARTLPIRAATSTAFAEGDGWTKIYASSIDSVAFTAAANTVVQENQVVYDGGDPVFVLDSSRRKAFWKSVRADCRAFTERKTVEMVLSRALWFGRKIPNETSEALRNLNAFFARDPATWSFWRDWYQRVLDGAYQNQKLLYDIALIPNEDWEKGPEHIAGLIRDLQAKHLAAATPLAEVVRPNDDKTKVIAEVIPINRPALYATGLQRMRDAFADAQANNEIGSGSQEARLIRRALFDYAGDAQHVHDNLVQARNLIEAQIAAKHLPGSGSALILTDTSLTFETDIRAWHPPVEEAVIARAKMNPAGVTRSELAPLEDARDSILVLTAGMLVRQMPEDIGEVIDVTPMPEGTLPAIPVEPAYRLASRLIRILQILKSGVLKVGEVADAIAKIYAAARLLAKFFGI